MRKLKQFGLFFILCLSCNSMQGQYNPLGVEQSFLELDREKGFLFMSSVALASYLVSDFLLQDEQLSFYQVHTGYYSGISGTDGGSVATNYQVYMQNVGVEREFSNWFSLRIELNLQEFSSSDYFTLGTGLKTYYKWTAYRAKKIHPFIEYGSGVFYAFDKFPQNASNFTFNLSYALGLEYILSNQHKIRMDYNYLHHSNNFLFDPNPGFDGNGVSLSYSWLFK